MRQFGTFQRNRSDLARRSGAPTLLGMTDKRTLAFTDSEFSYDSGGGVTFWGQDGETRVRSRISREALDDHFSEGGKLRPEAAFKKHRRQIEALARREYLLGGPESDGTVLITTHDVA